MFTYSGDTEPCPEVIQLAQNADILVHESTGKSLGHTDASQAGQIAKSAGVEKLYLIHYANGRFRDNGLIERAAQEFGGAVNLAEDFMEFDF